MTRRLPLTTLFLLGLPLSVAFGAGQAVPTPSELRESTGRAPAAAANLAGTWDGIVRLDSAWQLPERSESRSTAVRIRFQPVGDASPTTMSSRSVHAGTFEIDFARFGFRLSTHDALGWSVGSDSMRAVLNPAVSHGTVELNGVFRGDTIVGTWRYVSDPGGAAGTFVLRRVAGPGDTRIDATESLDVRYRVLGSRPSPLPPPPSASPNDLPRSPYMPQLTLQMLWPPDTGPVWPAVPSPTYRIPGPPPLAR